jgi:carbonic anhydrase/acetyltransferase-like protein (isoleucine patch superfamily)
MAIYALGDAEPEIHPDAFVHPDAVIIGRVMIGAQSSIWPAAVLRGDVSYISIGERTSIQDGSVIHCSEDLPTIVGDDCVIGHLVHLEGCTIESESLVGSNSVILHRAVIRRGALVGANALVPNGMVVPERAMALGVPAVIKENRVTPDMILPGVQGYVDKAKHYRAALRRIG